METRASYVLIGAFTVLGLIAALGFLLWLAQVELDRTYAQYDVLFDSVEGLGKASAVSYNGVDVGEVLSIALDRADPSRVRVRIEVLAGTPIRTDTVATLAAQGVTGVSFVSLAGGSADAPRLERVPPAPVPVIPSERSLVQGLMVDAPDFLTEAIALLKDVSQFTGPENRDAVAGILRNAEAITGRLDAAMAELGEVPGQIAATADQIAAFGDRLDSIGARTEAVLASAEATLANAEAALAEARGTISRANGVIDDRVPPLFDQISDALGGIKSGVADFSGFAASGLPEFARLAADARGLVNSLDALAAQVARDPGRFLLGNQTPAYRR